MATPVDKLRIPKTATESARFSVREDISSATSFTDLGELELYRGSLILGLEDKYPPQWHMYIYAIQQFGDDLELGEVKLPVPATSRDAGFSQARVTIDSGIEEGAFLEQPNEDIYVPDIEEQFFAGVKKHAQHLEDKAAASVLQSVDDVVREMQRSGGRIDYTLPDGKIVRGFVVEIFYDNKAYKYRARTNNGVNGLANAAFPNNKRQEKAVYIVSEMSYNGKNYMVPASTTMWRIR